MPKLNDLQKYIETIQTLPPFQKKLKDIPNEDYELSVLDINEAVEIDNTPVSIISSLQFGPSLFVFNNVDDNQKNEEDEDDLISSENPENEVLIIPDYNTQAFIQYQMGVSVKAAVPSNSLGFSFSGNAKANISVYKIHDRDDSLLKAASDDLQNFPWIFNLNDLKSLKENEACTLAFAGELTSSLEVSWSDLYSGSLFGTLKLFQKASPISIEVDAGASVAFDFGIKDDFSLVIKKLSGQNFEIGIKKNKRRSLNAGVTIGVSAQFAKESQAAVAELLNNLLEQILKKGRKEIEQLLEKTTVGELAREQMATIDLIADILGLPTPTGMLDEYKEKWDAFIEDLKARIETFAKAKVEAGVSFEYSQLKTENNLLIGEFSEEALGKYHNDLLKFKFNNLVKEKHSGITVRKFLQEKSYQRRSSFGFDLKIANTGLGVDHESSIEFLERTNEKNAKHIASKSEKSFAGQFFGESFQWTAALHAETDGFVYDPKIIDFNCNLHLGFEWQENKRLEKNEINKISDTAMLWGHIPQHKLDDLRDNLSGTLKSKDVTDIKVALKLEVPADVFKSIITYLQKLRQENLRHYHSILSTSLAACMFHSKDTMTKRIEEHGGYFLLYLEQGNQQRDHPTIRKYRGFISENHISQLEDAIEILVSRGLEHYSASSMRKVIRGFNKFHNNIYRVKVLGYLMFYFARIISRKDDIETSLKISYKTGNEEKVMNIIKQ